MSSIVWAKVNYVLTVKDDEDNLTIHTFDTYEELEVERISTLLNPSLTILSIRDFTTQNRNGHNVQVPGDGQTL